jgi:hypothetical protein
MHKQFPTINFFGIPRSPKEKPGSLIILKIHILNQIHY